jgi:hypothetical protein
LALGSVGSKKLAAERSRCGDVGPSSSASSSASVFSLFFRRFWPALKICV